MKLRFGTLILLTAVALLVAAAGRSTPDRPHLLPSSAGQVSAFAFDPRDPAIVYVGTIPGPNKGRVYKSGDGGNHWHLISGPGWTWLGALAADPQRPGTLYAGTGNAVYKTTNGGRTWTASSRGLLPPPGINRGEGWVDWLAVDPANSNILYEHDYANTIRKSVDGGRSWHPVWRKGWIAALLMVPIPQPALLAAVNSSGPRAMKPAVIRTADGGKRWQNTRLRVPVNSAAAFAVDPPRSTAVLGHTIYVALNARVYRSTDGGRSWDFIGQGLPQDAVVTGLAADAGTVFAAFGQKGIYETGDGGHTWKQSWPDSGQAPGLGAGIVAAAPLRPAVVYASSYYPDGRATGTHILRSTDSGLTWTAVG